jgi:hypothetical protein
MSDSQFKGCLLNYIQSIVKETVDLTLGQRFAAKEPPGLAIFSILDNMSPKEFEDAFNVDSNNIAA